MPDSERPELLLLSISNFISHRMNDIQKKIYPETLSSDYGYIISYLCDKENENVFQKNIESEFDLSRSTVSTILKELEKEGLVERKTVAADARLKKVSVTKGAKIINDACSGEMENFMAELFSDVNPQETEAFLNVLTAIKEKISNMHNND